MGGGGGGSGDGARELTPAQAQELAVVARGGVRKSVVDVNCPDLGASRISPKQEKDGGEVAYSGRLILPGFNDMHRHKGGISQGAAPEYRSADLR